MRTFVLCAYLILGGSTLVRGQERAPAPSAAEQPTHKATPEQKAVLDADQSFVKAYNQGDAKALAAHFSEDAEVIEADGTRYRGRPLIEQRLAETFAASPGVKLEVDTGAIQFLSPDVAREEGVTTVKHAKGAPEIRRHTAMMVKRDGRWLISSIREEDEPFVPPGERLKEIEWLVGEWIDESSDAHVRVSCRWSDDKNFLLRTLAVKARGRDVLTIQQRIGWDPITKQFRSWEFDSDGGYGEGRWSHDGDRWIIRHTAVRPEGVAASATHIMVRERPDLVRWASVDRTVGDQLSPTEETFVMVRVPPAPQSPAAQPARSPR